MESESPLILGIDLGTSRIKVALVTHGPNPKVETCLSRDIGLCTGHSSSNIKLSCLPMEHAQDVEKIFHCLHLLLSTLSPLLMSRVTAIAVTGQMHGVVGWLGNGLAFLEKSSTTKKKLDVNVSAGGCGKLITWMDRRCTKEFLDSLPIPSKSQKPFSGEEFFGIFYFTLNPHECDSLVNETLCIFYFQSIYLIAFDIKCITPSEFGFVEYL